MAEVARKEVWVLKIPCLKSLSSVNTVGAVYMGSIIYRTGWMKNEQGEHTGNIRKKVQRDASNY